MAEWECKNIHYTLSLVVYCIIVNVMETGRIERQPTVGELRWYAASICRVASYSLEQKKIEPTDENIREYVKTVWENPAERIVLNRRAALLRGKETDEVAKKYPDLVDPEKAHIELIDRYRHTLVDAREIVGDIVFQGEGVLYVAKR